MRRTRFAPLLSAFLLLACQATAPGDAGQATDTIAVTPLAAPGADTPAANAPAADPVAMATPATPHPKLRPENPATAAVAPAVAPAVTPQVSEPEAPKSAEQLLCEKTKGQWLSAGDTGANYCASLTRDGGKQCHKKGDCQGQCLARSGTCAPIIPLYGCNEILEKDGGQVTMCID